jgi:hypothetical protein
MIIRPFRYLLLAQALAAACGAPRSPDPAQKVVYVVLELPDGVRAERIRMLKRAANSPDVVRDRVPPAGEMTEGDYARTAGVIMPPGVIGVVLRAQAIGHGLVLAEGALPITADEPDAAPAVRTLVLAACQPPITVTAVFRSCEVAPDGGAPDGGAPEGGAPDGGGVRLPGDAGPDAMGEPPDAVRADVQPDWGPPACVEIPDRSTAPPLAPPAVVRPECQAYCALMQQNCANIYRTMERCEYACEALQWPARGVRADDDTIACRMSWAMDLPQTPTDRLIRCGHAAPDSADACGRSCQVYCRMGALLCGDAFPPEEVCKSGCFAKEAELRRVYGESLYSLNVCRFVLLQEAVFDRRLCTQAAPNNECGTCARLSLPLGE